MNHIMLDLETMGFEGNAAIIFIGAVAFNSENDTLGESFCVNVDLSSCIESILRVKGTTIEWWRQQSDEAKATLFKDGVGLEEALKKFTDYILQFKNVKVWGNGLGFDNVIIENAYKAVNKESPWDDFHDRDMRTIVDITQSIFGSQPKVKKGVAHNALDNAISQVETICNYWQLFKSK